MKRNIPRNQRIIVKHINQTFVVYSGKDFKTVTVTKDMVSYRFGDFVFTRINGLKLKKKLNNGSKNTSEQSSSKFYTTKFYF